MRGKRLDDLESPRQPAACGLKGPLSGHIGAAEANAAGGSGMNAR